LGRKIIVISLTALRDVVIKWKCKKNCRKSESILLLSYENTITEGANMVPVKVCSPRWTFSFISANW